MLKLDLTQGHCDLQAARKQLEGYVEGGLPALAYGGTEYIFCHAAAKCKVQLGIVRVDGTVNATDLPSCLQFLAKMHVITTF